MLVEILGLRLDLPMMNSCATCCARPRTPSRVRLLALAAAPRCREEIRRVIEDIVREDLPRGGRFSLSAEQLVKLMMELKELDDAAVYNFAGISKKFDEWGDGSRSRVINDVPAEMIAKLIRGSPRRPRPDSLPVGAHELAHGREHPAQTGTVRPRINDETLVVAERDYKRLSMETAQLHHSLLAAAQQIEK